MVLELRPPGIDKGRALESLADARGVRAVCYAGDDLGDLAAFDAVAGLRRKGLAGLAVCSGSDDVPELRARADLVLEGPPALVDFLNALSDAVQSRP
jgi:trehalose 6-phosphate phosphatase